MDDASIREALSGCSPVVVAVGKAARAMARAFIGAVPAAGRAGLVVTPHRGDPVGGLEEFTVGHPLPDEGSLAAGSRALEIASGLADDALLVVLLSGGASAGLTVPLADVTLADKVAATAALLADGVAIDGVNCVRKHLSGIKGGRLAAAAGGRVLTLAVSDVVDPVPDDPAVIGSGPTTADPTTFSDALTICQRHGVRQAFPATALAVLERGVRGELLETPKPGDPRLRRAAFRIIGSRVDALECAARAARGRGFAVAMLDEPVTGEARAAGASYVRTVARVAHEMPRPVCILSAGETTVRVKGSGRGGRNQEFALAAAGLLARRFPCAVVASVGTDGVDGPTDAAGALADTTTLTRAAEHGIHAPARYLDANDSHAFFGPLGDLIHTGPTDTNVGDLQITLIGS